MLIKKSLVNYVFHSISEAFYRSKQLNNSLLTVRSSSGSSPSSPPRQQCATWTTAVQESPRSYSRHVRVVVVGEREPQHDLLP